MEDIKRKLQLKYIFNTITHTHTHTHKLKIIANNLNNHSSIKQAKHCKLQS